MMFLLHLYEFRRQAAAVLRLVELPFICDRSLVNRLTGRILLIPKIINRTVSLNRRLAVPYQIMCSINCCMYERG